MAILTADDLVAGSAATYRVEIPDELLAAGPGAPPVAGAVEIRPVTVADLQRIGRAARDDDELTTALLVHPALVSPSLTLPEVQRLPAGLARFLVETIEERSGISTPRDALAELVQAPLARACFILAREFGWTPEQVSGLTVGQILLYVEMAAGQGTRR
jgi:hypothetical protein